MLRKVLCAVSAAALIFLCGCGGEENNVEIAKNDETKDKIVVYTSIYPMSDLAKKIGGDKAEVVNMVPAGTEPHDWEPTVNDMVGLENCDLFVYNGAGMEPWIDKVRDVLENKDIIKEASAGCELIDHDGITDPHTWLSVSNAKIEAENIANAMISADGKNKEYYEENLKKLNEKFDETDEMYKSEVKNFKSKNIIVSHEAFGYLCKEYGLTQTGIEWLNAEGEPEAAKMAEIIETVRNENIKVIFFEELVSSKTAETIAEETGAKCLALNPIEGTDDEENEDYFSIMKDNLDNLKIALE